MKRACLALALVLLMGQARAQSPEKVEQAKALFNAGAQAYSVGQFVAAIQAFDEAYKITPRPAILFSLAQAERRQYAVDHDAKRLERAVSGFRKYIGEVSQGGRRADAVAALGELEPVLEKEKAKGATTGPTTEPAKVTARLMVTSPTNGAKVSVDNASGSEAPFIGEVKPGNHTVLVTAAGHDPEKRDIKVLEGGLVALDLPLKEKPALLTIDAPAGADITVDGRLVGVAPLSSPVSLTHGRHFVAIMKTGAVAYTRDVDVSRGETTKIAPELSTSAQRKIAWIVIGTSVVALAAGGVFTGLSFDRENKAQGVLDEREKGNVTTARLDDYEQYRSDRDRFRTWSIATLGAGAALGITGVLLYAIDRPSTPMRDAAPADKGPTPSKTTPVEVAAAPLITPTVMGASFAIAF
jgi:hypothetical protein